MAELEVTLDGRAISIPAEVTQVNIRVAEIPEGSHAPSLTLNADHPIDIRFIVGDGDSLRVEPVDGQNNTIFALDLNPVHRVGDLDGIVQVRGTRSGNWSVGTR